MVQNGVLSQKRLYCSNQMFPAEHCMRQAVYWYMVFQNSVFRNWMLLQKKLLLTMKMMCRTDGSFPQFHQRFHPRHSLLYFIYCYLTHLPSTAFLLYNVSCKAPHNSRSIQGKSARLPERFFRLRISYCTAPVFRTSRPLGLPR